MKNSNLHISQNTYLPKLIHSLNAKGIATDKMIRKANLHYYDISNPGGFVLSSFLYHFLEQVQYSQGLYSIAGEFFEDFSLRGAGPIGDSLFGQPTLLQLMQGGIQFQHLIRTDHELSYAFEGTNAVFTFNMLGAPSAQKTILEDIAFAQTLDTFRFGGGEGWYPSDIYLKSRYVKRLEKLLGPGNYRLHCNQPENKIVFPMDVAFKMVDPLADQPKELDPNNNLSQQITRLLKTASDGTQLTFNQMVEISNLSPRTLSRRLAEEGKTFNQLATNVMFGKATELLSTTHLSVNEISQTLGYTDSANFIRAFKKTANYSPEQFRTLC